MTFSAFLQVPRFGDDKLSTEVTWKDSFATLGRFDVVDIVESENLDQVAKAAMIIRA